MAVGARAGPLVGHVSAREDASEPLPPGDDDKCPLCGGETSFGYGLAGGGMGAYFFCLSDACDWFFKRQDSTPDGSNQEVP